MVLWMHLLSRLRTQCLKTSRIALTKSTTSQCKGTTPLQLDVQLPLISKDAKTAQIIPVSVIMWSMVGWENISSFFIVSRRKSTSAKIKSAHCQCSNKFRWKRMRSWNLGITEKSPFTLERTQSMFSNQSLGRLAKQLTTYSLISLKWPTSSGWRQTKKEIGFWSLRLRMILS